MSFSSTETLVSSLTMKELKNELKSREEFVHEGFETRKANMADQLDRILQQGTILSENGERRRVICKYTEHPDGPVIRLQGPPPLAW